MMMMIRVTIGRVGRVVLHANEAAIPDKWVYQEKFLAFLQFSTFSRKYYDFVVYFLHFK